MAVQQARVQVDREGFNLMPPRREVLAALRDATYRVVDVTDGDGEWRNDRDTLVVEFAKEDVKSILEAVIALHGADEVLYAATEGKVYVLFWWD